MGTNCAPLVAVVFLFCYEKEFMLSFSDNNQADLLKHLHPYLLYFTLTLSQDI